jgi:(2Fe-2S) ferredoxin
LRSVENDSQLEAVPLWREPGLELEEVISKKKAKKAKKGRAEANCTHLTPSRARRDAKVRDHDAHVLVCGGGDCKKRGSKGVRRAFKEGLRAAGMNGEVRIDSVGCLGLCKHGPNVVVYPGGSWYLGLREEDVPEVVERHLKGGEPIERLAAGFRPRKKAKK